MVERILRETDENLYQPKIHMKLADGAFAILSGEVFVRGDRGTVYEAKEINSKTKEVS
jgi:hypothetical protein